MSDALSISLGIGGGLFIMLVASLILMVNVDDTKVRFLTLIIALLGAIAMGISIGAVLK